MTYPAGSDQLRAARHPGALEVLEAGSRVRLVLTGEVDASMNSLMVDAVNDVADRGLPIDVDTREVTFIDSAAIALLMYLSVRVPQRMRFIQPSDPVRFLMEITGLEDQVDILEYDPRLDEDPGT